ncbi:MAG: hypothetical protein KVP17_002327, partial [Porospora cf. gigantea B]|uniref:uncharacterized protein n=1 Tax=Porospora cf. gigantea B TaxID=2853592 RepID=UPI003571F26E
MPSVAIDSQVCMHRCVHTAILMAHRIERCPGLVIVIMLSVGGFLIIRNVELHSYVSMPSELRPPSARMMVQVGWTADLMNTDEVKMTSSPEPVISQSSSPESVMSPSSSPEPVISLTSSPEPVISLTSSPEPVISLTSSPESVISLTSSPEPVISLTSSSEAMPFDASSLDAVTELSRPVPWKEWSDRLPRMSYEDLEWRQPLGRVPFYMYDDEEWDNLMRVKFQCASSPKICPEFMFLHQLRFHPWRVNDIEKAAVVVLPIIISDLSTHGRNYGQKNQVEIQTKFAMIRKMIDPSKRHVLFLADWVIRHLMQILNWKPVSGFVVVSQAQFRPFKDAP